MHTVGGTVSSRGLPTGDPAPLGATVQPGGVNFSVFSKHATLIELLLFDDGTAAQPRQVIPLEAGTHCTYYSCHTVVLYQVAGQVCAHPAHGPCASERGLRFDGRQ